MTNIYFVRHAHSTYSTDEVGRPLSKKGFNDANLVADLLKEHDITHVISSTYKRAIQTVDKVAQQFDLTIELVDGFRERTLSERPVADFDEAIAKVWSDPQFSWEGGESNLVAQERGVSSLMLVLEKWKGKNVVIGTHGNIMVLIMNYFDVKYDLAFWEQLQMPDIYRLSFQDGVLKEVNRITKEVVIHGE
ncbi:MAG: histidine phosphatase family protein [Psychrobacillus psychrodurans]